MNQNLIINELQNGYETMMKNFKNTMKRQLGTEDIEELLSLRKQTTLQRFLSGSNNQHLILHEIQIDNEHQCLILSSKIYPEFGFLIVDAQCNENGAEIKILGQIPEYTDHHVRMLCGCCSPHLNYAEGNSEESLEKFILLIRKTCKEKNIQQLVFQCYHQLPFQMAQNFDDLHLIDWENKRSQKTIDQMKFAVAFSELTISKNKFPFLDLFKG
jgi:hypothetical protein